MAYNHYFYSNFRNTTPKPRCSDSHQSFSNTLYDSSKGITIYYLNEGTSDSPCYRTLYDVELAYSSDPSVTAHIPPQVQQQLRYRLNAIPKSGISTEIPIPQGLETSDRVELSKTLLAHQAHRLAQESPEPSPASPPQPADPQPIAE